MEYVIKHFCGIRCSYNQKCKLTQSSQKHKDRQPYVFCSVPPLKFFKRQEYMFYGHGMEWKWMHRSKIFFNGYFWEWDLGSDERIHPDPVCLQFVHVLLALKKIVISQENIRFSKYNLSRILKWNVSSKLIGIEEIKKLWSQGIGWIIFENHPTWLSKNMVETKYWKNVGLDGYVWQLKWVCK